MSRAANPFARARFLMSGASLDALPAPDRPEVAFAGRSNSGKSSALNRLCNQKQLARVSKTPGRTQLVNFFELAEGRLVDLPGYGYAEVPDEIRRGWGELVGGYIEFRQALRAVVLIMDSRRPLGDVDRQMLSWCQDRGLACYVLLSKSDKLTANEGRRVQREVQEVLDRNYPGTKAQLFSSQSGEGIELARVQIGKFFTVGAAAGEA